MVRKLIWQKRPIIFAPPKFTHFFTELLSVIRYFRTYGQQDVSVDFFFGTSEFENVSELSLGQKSYLEPNIERFEVQ